MKRYILKGRADGVHCYPSQDMEETNVVRAIVAIQHPVEISYWLYGERATPIVRKFTPDASTNQIQAALNGPRLFFETDHHQITEASHVNTLVIAILYDLLTFLSQGTTNLQI
ncbi:hypothetical protein JTB14_027131 [Gonioctena quinquepunctata]|nr:hypothetical protein JTB14_027131 [Gonioctena quinquepunctata]